MSRKGFTLIEILVAAVLGGILLVAIAAGMRALMQSGRGIQNSSDLQRIYDGVSLTISNRNACTSAFRSANQNIVYVAGQATAAVDEIRMGNAVVVRVGEQLPGRIVISAVDLLGAGVASDTLTIAGVTYNRHFLRLQVQATRPAPAPVTRTNYFLSLLTDQATNRMVTCATSSGGSTGAITSGSFRSAVDPANAPARAITTYTHTVNTPFTPTTAICAPQGSGWSPGPFMSCTCTNTLTTYTTNSVTFTYTFGHGAGLPDPSACFFNYFISGN